MPEYSRSQDVDAPADRLFDYLSKVENLPRYFPGMTSAEAGDTPGEVRVSADVEGKPVAGTARFAVEKDARRIDWSSKGPNDYHGWLEVTADRDASSVEVHIWTERRSEKDDIESGLEETLRTIRRLVEGGEADRG